MTLVNYEFPEPAIMSASKTIKIVLEFPKIRIKTYTFHPKLGYEPSFLVQTKTISNSFRATTETVETYSGGTAEKKRKDSSDHSKGELAMQ